MSAEVLIVHCGTVPYEEARAAQRRLAAARQAGEVPDLLLLLQHNPVYTRGRRSRPEELPMGERWYEMQGIEVLETERGGQVTYHGPGQLVAYPIASLRPYRDDVHDFVRRLERAAIGSLADHGVAATTIEGLTGVWVDRRAEKTPIGREIGPSAGREAAEVGQARKIGSIGLHVRRGVTTHGLAVNVNNDLQPFEWIVPCGIEGCRFTSLSRELGAEQDLSAYADSLAARYCDAFDREPVAAAPESLGLAPARLGAKA